MAKQKAADEGVPLPPTGTVLVRKGLYRGHNGRSFQSVPFGETLVCMAGRTYEVREPFRYLWVDPQFQHLWEWEGQPYEVPASRDGQIPPPA